MLPKLGQRNHEVRESFGPYDSFDNDKDKDNDKDNE